MKIKRTLIIALLFFFILPTFAFATATEEEIVPPEVGSLKGALPSEAKDILGNLSPTNPNIGDEGLSAIFRELKESFFDIFKNAIRSGLKIMVVIILCTLAYATLDDDGIKDAVNLCAAVAVSAIAIGDVRAFIGMGISTLNSLSDFSKVLLPTMCTAAASAGALTSAAAKFAATSLFIDILLTVGIRVIVPLISIYIATVIAGAALGKDTLDGISNLLKWIATTALTLLVTAFTAYIGFAGLITGKADEMAARVTKSAIGTLLPVVGGIVSDAAGTLVAGAGILRNSIGIFGSLAVAAVCITPFITIGAHYLVYKGTAALSKAITDKRMSELIGGVGTAFGMVLALVGVGGIMLFISVISSMKAVSGI